MNSRLTGGATMSDIFKCRSLSHCPTTEQSDFHTRQGSNFFALNSLLSEGSLYCHTNEFGHAWYNMMHASV